MKITVRAGVVLAVSGALAAIGYSALRRGHDTWIGFCIAYPGFITAMMVGGGIHGQTWQQLARNATVVNFVFYAVLLSLPFVFWDRRRTRKIKP